MYILFFFSRLFFSISKEVRENKYFVSADLQLDLVLLYFGGFKSIEENTLKLIKEENEEPQKFN